MSISIHTTNLQSINQSITELTEERRSIDRAVSVLCGWYLPEGWLIDNEFCRAGGGGAGRDHRWSGLLYPAEKEGRKSADGMSPTYLPTYPATPTSRSTVTQTTRLVLLMRELFHSIIWYDDGTGGRWISKVREEEGRRARD